MYGYGYSYPNNPQGSGLMGRYEAGVRSDGGSFAFPIDTGLASRLEGLGLLNASSLVNSCNAGKESVLYNLIPTPVQSLDRFAVTRSTVKWVLGANGVLTSIPANTPAFEYNSDGTYRGLLVEPAGTNLLVRSSEFNTTWGKSDITVTDNSIASPDGTVTADTITEGTAGSAFLSQGATVASGATVAGSIWLKAGSVNDFVRIAISQSGTFGNNVVTWFRFSTGVLSGTANSGTGTGATASVQAFSDGWYRITLSGAIPAVTAYIFSVNSASASGSGTRVNNSVYYAWGAQLETGSVATSYIPTVASTQTRTADSVTLTGASSLIGQQEGTVYAEGFITNFAGATDSIFTISDGTVNNRIEVNKRSPNTIALERVSAIQSGATTISSGALSTGLVRIAIAYKTGDTAIFINGVQAGATSTATFTMPTIGNLVLGANATAGTRFWNSNVRALVLLPTRLPNATLAALTA